MNLARSAVITALDTNITHGAVGDDDTAPAEGDTTLTSETYRDAEFSKTIGATSFSTTIFMDTAENNSNDIKETGTFNAGAGGTMYNHSLTNIISKTVDGEVFVENKFNITTSTS